MSAKSVYALLAKKDRAHEEKISGGVWAQITVADSKHDFIVTGGLDKAVKVWQFENYQLDLVHTLQGHKMGVISVAVSPDGHTIASISMDDNIIIWELLSGNKVREVEYFGSAFWTSAFSLDGDYLAVAGYSGEVVILEIAKNKKVQIIDTRANARGKFIISIAWSRDGKQLAVGSVDGLVRLYDLSRDGLLKHTIQAHEEAVKKVAFSPNSKFVATASTDGLVKIYNVKSAKLNGMLDHKCWAFDVCFSNDGSAIATGDDKGCVRVARARPLTHKHGDSDDESGSHTTMTSTSNGNVRSVEVATDKCGAKSLELEVLHVYKEHLEAVCCVQFSPDQTKLLSVSKDQSINVYEVAFNKKHNK